VDLSSTLCGVLFSLLAHARTSLPSSEERLRQS